MNKQLTWIVSNGKNKAILLPANSSDEARKKANENFYSPWRNEKDLNITQVFDENKHCHLENIIFKYVQFHSCGGVITSYDNTIKTKPTEEQIKFLNRPIQYVKLCNEH